MKRRRIIRSLVLHEISAVDRPAHEGAGAILRKNHMNDKLSKILSEAERVSKGESPTVTRAHAESAMLELAKREARDDEGVCDAYARLCESDERMQKLYELGQAADAVEDQRSEDLAKRATQNERVWELMVKGARHNRNAGETVEQALERMLLTDETYRDAYALYCE